MVEWLGEPALEVGGYTITRLEVLGDVTGLASVWWAARENVLTWPVGLVNSALFLLLFVDSRLYLSAALQVAFLVLGAFGWVEWARRGEGRPEVVIRRASPSELRAMAVAIAVGTLVLAVLAARVTDAVSPFWDSAVLVLSLVATFGQARKLIEFWGVFLFADLISIPLYLGQGLLPTAVLFGVFAVLCAFGFREWLGLRRRAVAIA